MYQLLQIVNQTDAAKRVSEFVCIIILFVN